MKKHLLNAFKFIFFLSVGIFLLWWVMKDYDIKDMWQKIRAANYFWVGLSLMFAILSHISRAIRWKVLINSMGYNARTTTSFICVMVGYLSNLAFPRMGEVLRCGILSKYENVPVNKVLGTVVTERMVDVLALLMLFIVTFFIEADLILNFIESKKHLTGLFNLFNLIIFAVVIIAIYAFYKISKKYVSNTALYMKIMGLMSGFKEGMKSVLHMEKKWLFIAHSIFIWMMYFGMTYICFRALPFTSSLGVGAGITTLTLGSIGMAAPVQGGIGTYHLSIQKAMMSFGISGENGLVYAWLIFIFQTLLVILLGALCFIALSFVKRKSLQNGSSNPVR